MRSGYVLKCGQMFFGTLIMGRLTLTSSEREAWFTDDHRLALEMSAQLEKSVGLMCVIANYTHGREMAV